MRHFKKLFSFLTIFCLLAGSVTTVSASGTMPHIKFTNESTDSTDLRIAKTVTGTGYPEHVKFRFKLKLDMNGDGTADRLSEPLTYTVTDRNGQIVRKSGGRVVEFTTDGNGIFELEDGQTATFKKVGTVAYEVTEESDYRRPKTTVTGTGDDAVETPVIDETVSYYRRTVRKEEGKDDVITDTELRPEYVYELRAMAKDGYTLTSPTGGSSGNVTAGMETIVFTNQYTDPSTASTVLRVQKTVSYPTGYVLPDAIKNAQFWFRLETADTKTRQYMVENPVNDTVETVRRTDEEGYFYLYAGETAAFADMKPSDAWRVYEIVEAPEGGKADKVCPAAWWPTGKTMQQGNTIPAAPVAFNNSNTALRVTKTVDEAPDPDAPEPEFTFQLLDSRENPMMGKTYYRYNMMSGALVLNGEEQTWTTGTDTGEQGYFRLKRNEEAVFCGFTVNEKGEAVDGIRPGTSVTVREIGRVTEENGKTKIDPSYAQQPDQAKDIKDTGAIASVDFVNTRTPVQGTLAVTKYVENATEEGSGADSDFHFILYKKDGGNYVPVENAFFEFGPEDAKQNLATGPDTKLGWEAGEFTIKAGETAKFTRLPLDTEYKVEEVKFTSEYKPKGIAPEADGSYQYSQTGTLAGNGSLEFTFTNVYTPKKVDIKINKVNDQGNPLPGADFMLYLVEGKGNGPDDMVLPTDAPASYNYTVKPDIYWLYEEKAPSGYRLLQAPLKIEIGQTETGLQVTIDDIMYEYTSGTEISVGSDKLKAIKITTGRIDSTTGEALNDVLELTIPNIYLYELPNSGGIGIYWYSIGGVLLMMAAALILYRKNIWKRGVLRD